MEQEAHLFVVDDNQISKLVGAPPPVGAHSQKINSHLDYGESAFILRLDIAGERRTGLNALSMRMLKPVARALNSIIRYDVK